MHELERDKEKLAADPANLNVIFKEMIQICLWCEQRSRTTHPYTDSRITQGECNSMDLSVLRTGILTKWTIL